MPNNFFPEEEFLEGIIFIKQICLMKKIGHCARLGRISQFFYLENFILKKPYFLQNTCAYVHALMTPEIYMCNAMLRNSP